jgi:hypothetical protein
VNLGDRRGRLDFRQVGTLHLVSTYASRYVFDPSGNIDARRRNSPYLTYTPSSWLWLSGITDRTGIAFPLNPG